jgi:hypothetical protein
MSPQQTTAQKDYTVLQLKPGASLESIKNSYKTLVKIWHPDLFPSDQPKAQEKAHKMFLLRIAVVLLRFASSPVGRFPAIRRICVLLPFPTYYDLSVSRSRDGTRRTSLSSSLADQPFQGLVCVGL